MVAQLTFDCGSMRDDFFRQPHQFSNINTARVWIESSSDFVWKVQDLHVVIVLLFIALRVFVTTTVIVLYHYCAIFGNTGKKNQQQIYISIIEHVMQSTSLTASCHCKSKETRVSLTILEEPKQKKPNLVTFR